MRKEEVIHQAKERVSNTNMTWWVVEFENEMFHFVAPAWVKKNACRPDVKLICEIVPKMDGNKIIPTVIWQNEK